MPIAEISVLINVSGSIGLGRTILAVLFTAMLGAYLVKQQGFSTISRLQSELNKGHMPAMEMAEGIALLLAGAVLITPGFITDAIGFALLTPPLRQGLIRWVFKQGLVKTNVQGGFAQQAPEQGNSERDSQVIEGEYQSRD